MRNINNFRLKNTKQDSLITSYKNWLKTNTSSFLNKYWISGTEEYKPSADWVKWWECGTFVNNYLNSLWIEWRVFWSSLESKKKAITPGVNNPIVGAVVIMDTGVKLDDWTPAGHVGIVTKVFDDWSFLVTDSNWNHKQQVSTHKIEKWSNAYKSIEWYYLPGYTELEKALSSTESTTTWDLPQYNDKWELLSKNGVPEYYETMILNQVPATLRNSDEEYKNLMSRVKNYYDWWLSADEALYTYMWFHLEDYANNQKNLAKNLIERTKWYNNLPSQYYTTIASNINANNPGQAVQYTESIIWDANKTQWGANIITEWESDVRYLYEEIDKLIKSAKENGDKLWRWDALRGNMWQETGIGDSDNYTDIKSNTAWLFNKYRNSIFGSALTESEIKEAKKELPTTRDKEDVFIKKLETFKARMLSQLNAKRWSMNLPMLDKQTLFDYDKRAQLYQWATQWTTTWNKIKK